MDGDDAVTSASEAAPTAPRTALRAATNLVVETYDAEERTLLGIGRVWDLSVDGACLDSTQEFSEGDGLVLRFLLDAVRVIRLPVSVVWRRSYAHVQRYGLRVRSEDPAIRAPLTAFVQSQAGRFLPRPEATPEVPS
jgi:hypothetical protein